MKISIITPAYNAADWLGETIESVMAQTYSNWEMIIMDDGSVDNTREVILSYATKDPRIKYYYQPNGGMGMARNEAIKHASGQYLAFIDADDLWMPDKLEKQLQVIERENVDLVYTAGLVFKDNIQNVINEVEVPEGRKDASDFLLKQLYGFTVPVLSVLVKKQSVLDIGGFEESKKSHFAADYQLWLRLIDGGSVFFGLNEKLFYYRTHDRQATASDGLALGPVLWALHFANLKSISKHLKQTIMKQRLNRYIIHEMDFIPQSKLDEMLKLYMNPLGRPLQYWFMRGMLFFGKNFTKKWAYRFLDLSQNQLTK